MHVCTLASRSAGSQPTVLARMHAFASLAWLGFDTIFASKLSVSAAACIIVSHAGLQGTQTICIQIARSSCGVHNLCLLGRKVCVCIGAQIVRITCVVHVLGSFALLAGTQSSRAVRCQIARITCVVHLLCLLHYFAGTQSWRTLRFQIAYFSCVVHLLSLLHYFAGTQSL